VTVTVNVATTGSTEWLVTHDPAFEKNHARRLPGRYKQAALMNNKAVIMVQGVGSPVVELVKDNALIFSRSVPDRTVGGKLFFHYRTDADGDGKADTDDDGHIIVEGHVLADGPGDYEIVIRSGGVEVERRDLKIAPIMSDLSFAPDILAGPPAKFDPYTDVFDVAIGWGGQWYGMEIWYDLDDDVVGAFGALELGDTTIFSFNADSNAVNNGDLTGTHYLRMDNSLMRNAWTNYDVKWEGFNDEFDTRVAAGEKADEVFLEGFERELGETWGHPIQSHRGLSPWCVVGEGAYLLNVGVKREADESQRQYYEIAIEVEYDK
jgi:hypothetical protein